jgi:hypothetical protein
LNRLRGLNLEKSQSQSPVGITWTATVSTAPVVDLQASKKAALAGLWAGLPLTMGATSIDGPIILHGLCGAMRCLVGHDFRYAIPGNWLESRMQGATK